MQFDIYDYARPDLAMPLEEARDHANSTRDVLLEKVKDTPPAAGIVLIAVGFTEDNQEVGFRNSMGWYGQKDTVMAAVFSLVHYTKTMPLWERLKLVWAILFGAHVSSTAAYGLRKKSKHAGND